MTETRPIRIRFLLCDQMLTTSSALPMEMLLAAESRVISQSKNRTRRLDIASVASDKQPVTTRLGLQWVPDFSTEDLTPCDLVYVPGLWRNPRPSIKRHPDMLEWLKAQHQNGATLAAVGTGCCFLAEAGLLDGKVATTHWHYFDQFQQDYPRVLLKRQHFITRAGNLYCAASVNSLADLTVYFIQRLFGKSVASHVERHFSHEIRRAYDSNSFFEAEQNPHPDEEIIQIQIWLQDNYQKEIHFPDLAGRFGMSQRTLNRRFKQALGKTPLEYLQEIRISSAKDLLKTTNLSVGEVADKVGYQDIGYFSSLFRKTLATTPSAYRATVRGKLFSAK